MGGCHFRFGESYFRPRVGASGNHVDARIGIRLERGKKAREKKRKA